MLFLALALLWWLVGTVPEGLKPSSDTVILKVEGNYYQLSSDELIEQSARTGVWFSEGEKLIQKRLNERIEREIDDVFDPVKKAIPVYLDWRYSVAGEYLTHFSQLGNEAADFAGIATVPEKAIGSVRKYLIEDTNLMQSLKTLSQDIDSDMLDQLEVSRDGWIEELTSNLTSKKRPEPLLTKSREKPIISIDASTLDVSNKALMTSSFEQRQAFSGLLATSLLSKTIKRSVGKAATKVAARIGLKFGAGALAGGTTCSVLGHGAVACSLVTGTVYAGTEYVIIEIEESMNRERARDQLHMQVDTLKNKATYRLKNQVNAQLNAISRERQKKMESKFFPVDDV